MNIEDKDNVDIWMNEENGKHVIAKRDFEIGDIVLSTKREYVKQRATRHSLQWDYETHIEVNEPGKFINHSCDANVAVRRNDAESYDFYAIKKIEEGNEIRADY